MEYNIQLVELVYIVVELVESLLELNVDMELVMLMNIHLVVDMYHVVLLFDAVEVAEVVDIFHRLLLVVLVEEVDIVQQ